MIVIAMRTFAASLAAALVMGTWFLAPPDHWEVSTQQGVPQIEALVDAGQQFLHSLETKIVPDSRTEPVSKMTVLDAHPPVDEELSAVASTWTEDGRIGKVLDRQGLVTVKPRMHRRWTPVKPHLVLKPGDWVRTDLRGANAVLIRLAPQNRVTLGPGCLVELESPGRIRVLSGELQVVADPASPIQLIGPKDQVITVDGTAMFRLDEEKLVRLPQDPLWLRGFEGATADESIGSLVWPMSTGVMCR